jgi:acyl dehydratase
MTTETIARRPLTLEDLAPGQIHRAEGEPATMDAESIKAFARQFDPQPFHLDEALAAKTFFRGLAASGWHTAAVTMKLLVEGGLPLAGGIVGAGVEEVRWVRPVRPGDRLRVETEGWRSGRRVPSRIKGSPRSGPRP